MTILLPVDAPLSLSTPYRLTLADLTPLSPGMGGNTGGRGGRAFDAVTISGGGTAAYSRQNGERGLRVAAGTSSTARLDWTGHAASAMSMEVHCAGAAAPVGGENRVLGLFNGTGYAAAVNHLTDGRLRVYDAAGASIFTTVNAVPATTGWRVHLGAEPGTGPGDGLIRFALYLASGGTGTTPVDSFNENTHDAGTTTLTEARFGVMTSTPIAAYTLRYAELLDNDSAPIGPLRTGQARLWSASESTWRRRPVETHDGQEWLVRTVKFHDGQDWTPTL